MAAKKQEKLSGREAAEVVLLENGKPMHYREITREAVERGIVRVKKGKRKVNEDALVKTVRAYLCDAEGDRFVRVEPGVFNLTPARRRALKKAQKAKQKAEVAEKAVK